MFSKSLLLFVFLCLPTVALAQTFTLDKNTLTLPVDGSSQIVTATLALYPPVAVGAAPYVPPGAAPTFTSGISWTIVPNINVTTFISDDRTKAYTTFTATAAAAAGAVTIVGTYQGFTQTVTITTVAVATPPAINFAPDEVTQGLKIVRNGNHALLRIGLTRNEDYPKGVLDIRRNEIVALEIPRNVIIASSNPEVISVVGNRYLVALDKRGEAKITATYVVNVLQVAGVAAIPEVLEVKSLAGVITTPAAKPVPAVAMIPAIQKDSILRLSDAEDGSLSVRIGDEGANILASPKYRPYVEVRDAYGSRIAKNFVVIQVTIANFTADKQYLLKDVSVSFDPNQCDRQKENWKDFKKNECIEAYQRFFQSPVKLTGTDNDSMLAIGEAEKYKSKRYMLFQAARFVADVGGGLTAFKLLGRDGITGFAFLGGAVFNAADALLPKVYLEKKKRLETDLAKENSIVGDKPLVLNLFIPATFVLSKDFYKIYKKRAGKLGDRKLNPENKENVFDADKYKTPFVLDPSDFDHYMLLFLVADAKGVLIDRNATPVNAKRGGGIPPN